MIEPNRNLVIIKDIYIATTGSILLNSLVNLIINPSKLNALAAIDSICSSNSKLLPKIIPESLKLLTISLKTPFRV